MENSQGKHWCFTLNNYSEDEIYRLSTLPNEAKYMVVGKEKGDNGTPHLQGIIGFHKRCRFNRAKAIISDRCHLELARNIQASLQYCRKEGDFYELGELPVAGKKGNSGERSDLEDFKRSVQSGILSTRELIELHSDVYAKYSRFVLDYVRMHLPKREVEDFPLRDWQQQTYGILQGDPDSRSILFIVDTSGNTGKSWFCDWYCQKHEDAQIILPGKKADMVYALDPTIRVLFIDAPRSKQGEYIQYDFLEDVKNGRVFSGKYESGMKYLQKVHVVVMMNEMPDENKLSSDRYVICEI